MKRNPFRATRTARRGAAALVAVLTLQALSSQAVANLIPINIVPSSGNGLGTVNSVVTFQNTGTEVGAIGLAAGGAVTLGSTVAYGIENGFPNGGGTTNEQTGSGNNVYTTASLGILASGSNTFANLVLIFNGNEGGNPSDQAITLTNLSLNLFNTTTGNLLGSFSTIDPFSVMSFPGVGNAGFGFQLDAAQAAQANAILLANPNLTIGAAARATGANAGFETISISRINTTATVPDESSTVLLLGSGLLGMALLRGRRAFLKS
ncbi:MAG: hypothetical protein ABIV50_13960, partial [Opitutus sp.]